jgi:hypothetical protein
MTFTGSAVVHQVSDRVVRITGISLAAGESGAIALHGSAGAQEILGAAAPFALLAREYTNEATETVIDGDLGYVIAPAEDPTVSGATHVNDATYAAAAEDVASVLAELQALPATFSFAPGNINLSTDVTHGPVGVYTPGVYDVTGDMSIQVDPISLSGRGLFVFRSTGAFTAGSIVRCVGGAHPNDVWWIPGDESIIAAGLAPFSGNVLMPDQLALVISQNVAWIGRALGALSPTAGSNITTEFDTDETTITTPTNMGDTVFLPAALLCSPQAYGGQGTSLQDLIQCTAQDAQVIPGSTKVPIAVVKTGTTVADFLIVLTNTSVVDSPALEIFVRYND